MRVTSADRSGFTLVEMLVTVALSVIIMWLVVVAFTQGGGVFMLAHAQTDAMHSAQLALDFLEKDLQTASSDHPFIGVVDTTNGEVDNDGDGSFDEDLDTYGVPDPVDFKNGAGQERHGLEFVTMSMFAMDEQGQPVPAVHVLYWLTRDELTERGYEAGRLIRHTVTDLSDPLWLDPVDTGGWPSVGLGQQDQQTIAFGVTQLRLRYYYPHYDAVGDEYLMWHDTWDSTDPASWQFHELPQAVEVTLRVVDSDMRLDKADRNPVVMRRLIPVGTVP